jgi:hypothetical protein
MDAPTTTQTLLVPKSQHLSTKIETLQRPLLSIGRSAYLLPVVSCLAVFSPQIWAFIRFTLDEAEDIATDYTHWEPYHATLPFFSFLAAFMWGIYILAYPPSTPLRRKLSMVALLVPLGTAMMHGLDLWPEFTICDTLIRFCYIWFAHMSFEVTILEFTPKIPKEKDCLSARLREAHKVLFGYNRSQFQQESKRRREQEPAHGYTHNEFLARHVWKIVCMFTLRCAYAHVMAKYVPEFEPDVKTNYASFFRRIGDVNANEMWHRLDMVFDWTVATWWLYDQYHSVVAIFFVNITRLDEPDEWRMSVFGSPVEAWTVRRFWGKFWHNFVYSSFSAHARVVTRQWLGMKRGQNSTRLAENTLVFLLSGLGHSLVRWAEQEEYDTDKEIWCIAMWYVAQMLPIMIEEFVHHNVLVETRRDLAARYPVLMTYAERTIGYLWVFGWMMWSVPKYTYTRIEWSVGTLRQHLKFAAENDTVAAQF